VDGAAREQLPPIEAFLDNAPRRPGSEFGLQLDESSSDFSDEQNVVPPIEHFLDPLPAVVSFAPDSEASLVEEHTAMDYASAPVASRSTSEPEWVEEDWQRFDWRAAAALGEGPDAAATSEWAATNWDTGGRSPHDAKGKPSPPAQVIAKALDQIARKIRQGELTVPQADAITDPAGIAATLASLLGVRR
jgi:hypothetical protein